MNDDKLKAITVDELRALGLNQVAYLRPFTKPGPKGAETPAYTVHAADGAPLFMTDRLDQAIGRLNDRSMFAVTVH